MKRNTIHLVLFIVLITVAALAFMLLMRNLFVYNQSLSKVNNIGLLLTTLTGFFSGAPQLYLWKKDSLKN